KEVNEKIEALWKQWPNGTTALTLASREGARETHVLKRGDWLKPTTTVSPGVPAFLHSLPATESDAPSRLLLAKWLVDAKSPTTARVAVNRLWQTYFGQGIVATPEDFGMQSEPPSHPELLDWLACELMQPILNPVGTTSTSSLYEKKNLGTTWKSSLPDATTQRFNESTPWTLKHIHRLIVTSATYRQSSRVTPELYTKDPY